LTAGTAAEKDALYAGRIVYSNYDGGKGHKGDHAMNKRTQRNILIIPGLALLLGFSLISCDDNKCPGKNYGGANYGKCATAVDEKGALIQDSYCDDFGCAARKLAINHEGKKGVRATCSCN
jgi:hypothetical protein